MESWWELIVMVLSRSQNWGPLGCLSAEGIEQVVLESMERMSICFPLNAILSDEELYRDQTSKSAKC